MLRTPGPIPQEVTQISHKLMLFVYLTYYEKRSAVQDRIVIRNIGMGSLR